MDNIKRDMIKYLENSLDKIELYNIVGYSKNNLTDGEKKDRMYIEIQKSMLEELKEGYKIMEEINLEFSELGLQSDLKDLKKYEERIMGSGV